jgi:small subunit ribosomal protein S16
VRLLKTTFLALLSQGIDRLGYSSCRRAVTWAIICGFFRVQTLFGNIMVVIRLARGGAKKRPFFNIVATDSRNRRDGRFIERIGFYNPVAAGAEESVRIVQDRLAYWQGVGAQLSPTVARLVAQAGKAQAGKAAA